MDGLKVVAMDIVGSLDHSNDSFIWEDNGEAERTKIVIIVNFAAC